MGPRKSEVFALTAFFILIVSIFGACIYTGIRRYNNIDRITYNGRTYNKSNVEVAGPFVDMLNSTSYTGTKTKGMEVYDDKDNPYASTIIFLKAADGKFIVYSLSGGP